MISSDICKRNYCKLKIIGKYRIAQCLLKKSVSNIRSENMHSSHSLDSISLKDKKSEVSSVKVVDDGGYGWVIVASTFSAFSILSFHFLTFGIFAPEFAATFSLSEAELGLIASLRFGFASISGIFGGPLVQRFGCRPVAMAAVIITTVAYVMTALSEGFLTLTISYGIVAGFGAGMIRIPSIVIVQRYFTRRRAIAAGLSSVGIGVFAFICSPLARFLVDTFGWRGASLMFGGLSFQMLVSTALYRPPELGQPCSASQVINQKKKESCSNRMKNVGSYFFKRELFTCYYVFFLVANMTRLAILETYYLRLAMVATSIGVDPLRAAILPSILALFTTTARGLCGFLAHWVPPYVLLGTFDALTALLVFVVPLLPNSYLPHAILAAIVGFCLGTVMGIINTTLVTLVGLQLLPLALSWAALFQVIFRIPSNLFVGWLLDETGSYSIPLWYAATIHSIGSLGGIAINFMKWREKKSKMTCTKAFSMENSTGTSFQGNQTPQEKENSTSSGHSRSSEEHEQTGQFSNKNRHTPLNHL